MNQTKSHRFPILRSVFRQGASLSAFKLALMAASISRPWAAPACRIVLRLFARASQIWVTCRLGGRSFLVAIRQGELASDFCSVHEIMLEDTYRLPTGFAPDVVVDGGGNIGLFTLAASAHYPTARILTCEPVPANLAQIENHLAVNEVARTTVVPACLGGTLRTIPFYCREANQGSFDPALRYERAIEVPVRTLDSLLAETPADAILIKLDIEGMELETLEAFVRPERRRICVVGELHDHKANKARLAGIFERAGWRVEFYDESDPGSIFRAFSIAPNPET